MFQLNKLQYHYLLYHKLMNLSTPARKKRASRRKKRSTTLPLPLRPVPYSAGQGEVWVALVVKRKMIDRAVLL